MRKALWAVVCVGLLGLGREVGTRFEVGDRGRPWAGSTSPRPWAR